MKHRTHAWSLAGVEAVAYSLARGKAAAATRESGEVAACSLARERRLPDGSHLQLLNWAGPRQDREKTPKPLLSRSIDTRLYYLWQKQLAAFSRPRYHARGARAPEDHVSTNY